MCNCVEENTKVLKKHILENNDGIEKINYVLLPATHFSPIKKISFRAEVSLIRKLKNGKQKDVTEFVNLIGEYCPFCGVKYE